MVFVGGMSNACDMQPHQEPLTQERPYRIQVGNSIAIECIQVSPVSQIYTGSFLLHSQEYQRVIAGSCLSILGLSAPS